MANSSSNKSITLEYLNTTYTKLHAAYEKLFWISYMGDHSVDDKLNKAQADRELFRSNTKLADAVRGKKGFENWQRFFDLYQIPEHALDIRKKIAELEARMLKIQTERKEGYQDPSTGAFVEASQNKMRTLIATHPDESVRKACFDAMEELPLATLPLYIDIINKRNEFARALGHEDFYAYRLRHDEDMSKKELFGLFDDIYERTKYAFKNLESLEKTMPGLRKPWNFSYMMTGDFTKEEDPYFTFDSALVYWGTSFAALGVDFAGGSITLDLLDRKGKYNNGFCHWPELVHFKKGKRMSGKSNFTCNAIPGQIGSGIQGLHTLFHEGGHAAHLLNSMQHDVCLNTEYPPQSASWSETQSMFMDSISSSIEWKMRYAVTADGKPYSFDLYKRRLDKIYPLIPLAFMSMMFVSEFEKRIYECKNLTSEFVLQTARDMHKRFFDRSENTIGALNIPHIYAWESSANYHGYALAELAVYQWRDYFYKKYGYIVDNKHVGKEMKRVWQLGAKYPSKRLVEMATGKKLSTSAFIKDVTRRRDKIVEDAQKKIKKLETVPRFKKSIDLDVTITLVHGKEKIADNKKGFEMMDQKYRKWLSSLNKEAK